MTVTDQHAGVFNPRRLGHVNLWAGDLKRSEQFYSQVCGLSVEFWETDLVATFLGTGNTPHDLGMIEVTGGDARYGLDGVLQIPAGVGTEPGFGHMAWELTNERELVDGFNALRGMGIEPEMTVDHQIAHSVYIRDPDGHQIEFYCDTVVNWSAVLHGELKLVTTNWTPGEEEPFTDSRVAEEPEYHTVDAAPVHPVRVTHVVMATRDLDAMETFYRSIAGLRVVRRDDARRIVWFAGCVADYPYSIVIGETTDAAAGYHHVSFDLGSVAEVDAALDRLESLGITPERVVRTAHKASFFLVDPDGLRAEFSAAVAREPDLSGASDDDVLFLV